MINTNKFLERMRKNVFGLKLIETKEGKPGLRTWGTNISGERITVDMPLNNNTDILSANMFIIFLDTGIDIKFKSFTQYNEILTDVNRVLAERRCS